MTALLHHLPGAIDRVRREIVLAHFLGKLAVDQGARELRQRVDAALQGSGSASISTPTSDPTDATFEAAAERADRGTATARTVDRKSPAAATTPEPIAVGSLALSDYDHLPASDIVAKLASLEPAERAAIEAYERRHRGRRTVLGKLQQLESEESS